MKPSILVIDDEMPQAIALQRTLQLAHANYYVESAYEEDDMLAKIENIYFHIAVVDLQMDGFKTTDGIILINKILKINPLAKIIIVSAYLSIYDPQIQEIFKTGRIICSVDKGINGDAYNDKIINAINTELEKPSNETTWNCRL